MAKVKSPTIPQIQSTEFFNTTKNTMAKRKIVEMIFVHIKNYKHDIIDKLVN